MTNLIYKTRIKQLVFNDFDDLFEETAEKHSEPYEDDTVVDLSLDELILKLQQFRSDLILFQNPTNEHPIVIKEITIEKIFTSEDEYQSKIDELEDLIRDAYDSVSSIRSDLGTAVSELEDIEYNLDI